MSSERVVVLNGNRLRLGSQQQASSESAAIGGKVEAAAAAATRRRRCSNNNPSAAAAATATEAAFTALWPNAFAVANKSACVSSSEKYIFSRANCEASRSERERETVHSSNLASLLKEVQHSHTDRARRA